MEESVRNKLNRETAKVDWQVLGPFYARNQLLAVRKGTDLIEVAACISEDNAKQVKAWQEQGVLYTPNDDNALHWHDDKTSLWAVVVKPWLIVQEI